MSVDRERPGTWVPYRASNCSKCKATCCTMPVEVKLPDLVRLGLVGEDEAAFNIRNMVRRLVKEGWIKSYREKTGVFLLAQKNGDDCVYLDSKTRRCTVYEKRPDTCREFPQKKGSRLGWCPYLPTTTS